MFLLSCVWKPIFLNNPQRRLFILRETSANLMVMKSFSEMPSCDGIPKFQVCCRCLNNLQCGHLTPRIIGISRIRSAGTCVLKILSGTAFDGRERGKRGKHCVLQGQRLFRLIRSHGNDCISIQSASAPKTALTKETLFQMGLQRW